MTENNPLQRCLHCEIARLHAREFARQPIEKSVHDLLEVIADWISGTNDCDEQARLMQTAFEHMRHNHTEILAGTYKRDSAPPRAN